MARRLAGGFLLAGEGGDGGGDCGALFRKNSAALRPNEVAKGKAAFIIAVKVNKKGSYMHQARI